MPEKETTFEVSTSFSNLNRMVLSFIFDGIPKRRECFRMASEAKKKNTKKISGNEFQEMNFIKKIKFPREEKSIFLPYRSFFLSLGEFFFLSLFFPVVFWRVLLEMGGSGFSMSF